ncbi:hypothetical protein BRC93_00205 [Halobacteriales archaeon QS_5_70_15]|nr:MAG: hypothetical protein BRC93_00205 [Halobacteriales archaeon QS_5_70_15]
MTETGELVGEGIGEQTHRTLGTPGAILRKAGTSFEHALRAGVHLTDTDDYAGSIASPGTGGLAPRPTRRPSRPPISRSRSASRST